MAITIAQLIKNLEKYPDDTKVLVYDPEEQDMVGITGFLYDPDANTLEICTDDNE